MKIPQAPIKNRIEDKATNLKAAIGICFYAWMGLAIDHLTFPRPCRPDRYIQRHQGRKVSKRRVYDIQLYTPWMA